jgi:hypothetical protein
MQLLMIDAAETQPIPERFIVKRFVNASYITITDTQTRRVFRVPLCDYFATRRFLANVAANVEHCQYPHLRDTLTQLRDMRELRERVQR